MHACDDVWCASTLPSPLPSWPRAQVELEAYSQLVNVLIAWATVPLLHYLLFFGATRWGWLTSGGTLPDYLVFPFPDVRRWRAGRLSCRWCRR